MENVAPNIGPPTVETPFLNRLLKVFGYAIVLLIGLFLALYFLLQIEFVQNVALKTTTRYVSKELKTTVNFDHISFDFFDKLVLENFYAEDFHGDTLLYSEALTINLNTNIFKLLRKELKIDDLTLSGATFYMRRYPNERKDDFMQLLDKLGENSNKKREDNTIKKAGKPFFLDVDALYLRDVAFIQDDSVGGEELRIHLARGDIFIDSLNLAERIVVANKIRLSQPYVTLINFPKHPLPVDTTATLPPKTDIAISVPNDSKKWSVNMVDFGLNDGTFIHHNYRSAPIKTTRDDQIDYNHLNVYDINILAADFTIQDWIFKGESKQLSLKEGSGFILDNLSATEATVSPKKIELFGMSLITPYSNLGDTLVMKFKKYPDFIDYVNKVTMDGQFDEAYVAVRDIMAFAPELEGNTFFAQNKNEVIYIDGNLRGRVNNLKGRNLNLRIGQRVRLKGNFNSRNLTQTDEAFLSLKLAHLYTNMNTLRQLIPNFNPPENFDKLGRLSFTGRFDGFFNDFVTDGTLQTNLGIAAMDMKLNSKQGRAQAEYSGQLSLTDFDLARWTDNPNFGLVTVSSSVYDGVGLTQNTASAKLKASIDYFAFKGYDYKNLNIEGDINKNLFIGDFGIHDDNIDFLFDGTINFEENVPVFDFKADINRVDLKQLNLLQEDFILAGDIDLKIRGNNINDLLGRATLYEFTLIKDKKETYQIDSLKFSSAITSGRKKAWRANSELFKASLVGDFKVTTIGEALLQQFEKNFTGYANRFGIHSKRDTTVKANEFDFKLELFDTKNFTYLLDKNLDTLKDVHLNTYFDLAKDTLFLDLEMPQFQFGNFNSQQVKLVTGSGQKEGKVDFSIKDSKIGNLKFDYVSFLSYIENDSATFNLNAADLSHELDKLNLEGKFALAGEQFNIALLPTNLVILNKVWTIEPDNYLQIGKDFIQTQNFQISEGNQKVAINSLLDKGLALEVNGFNASYIDTLWDFDALDFEGQYRLDLKIEDLFALENLQLDLIADTFNINWDNYGELALTATAPNIKSPIDVRLTTKNGNRQMALVGFYNPPSIDNQSQTLASSPNYLDLKIDINKYPLHLAEYFVRSGISGTYGNIDAILKLNGLLSDPNLDGNLRVYDGGTLLEYTNTLYTIKDEQIKMNNDWLLDASGGTIFDEAGNAARIEGGISHQFFNKLALDCRVKSDHFTVINTTKADNEVYYGKGIGKGDIYFSGNFDQTNIDIKATTARGTRVSIPVSSESTVEKASFIRFEKEDTAQITQIALEPSSSNEITGINLQIELEMTDAAEVLLIFDEQAGDIMKGTGNGNIKLDMNRSGDITMYGNYEIEQGEYLFTLLNVVNKPFLVKRGGTINWTGDPYNAIINIGAEYKALSTSPYNFILEYLNDEETKIEARKSTAVDLTMGLTGQLLKPNISFSLDFPNLTGEIKNYTDNKVRSVELDQNELNTQVLGLILFGGFLPSNQGTLLAGRQSQLAINTLSELLSNQLSIYLTELFAQGLSDNNFLVVEDFDVNYNQYDATTIDNPNDLATGHEFSINPKFRVKDRWVVNIAGKANLGGGNVVNNNSDALVTGDFIIEYELTQDRRLKVRGYYKNEPEIFGGRRNNAGVGLSFRKEFNNFDELFYFMKRRDKTTPPTIKKENNLGN